MSGATYEILPDSSCYGEIRECKGVYANVPTLEGCRTELQEVLEGWIIVGLRLGHKLPEVDGVDWTSAKKWPESQPSAWFVLRYKKGCQKSSRNPVFRAQNVAN